MSLTPPARPGERSLHGRPARFATGFAKLAEGTYAWLQPNGDWSESNAGLIVGDGGAALIDTAWDNRLTRRILDAAEPLLAGTPISTLVVTHGDGDHVNGTALLPHAELVAAQAAAGDMAEEHPAKLHRSAVGARLLARAGIGAPRRFGSYVAGMFAPFDLRDAGIRTPDRTFTDRIALSIGGRPLELRQLGPAHTAGDTIVHLPGDRIVFAGDLLFAGVTPNSWSGSVRSWRGALAAILELEPRIVVPGHGPVGGPEQLLLLDRYWSWLDTQARPLLAAGASVDEAALRIVTSDAFGEQPWSSWECPERTVLNVVIIDRERRGLPTAIAHRERPRLMWKVAMLAHQIPGARRAE